MSDFSEYRQTLVKLVDHLLWAVDLLDMYDQRMVQLGDPKELVYSAAHVNRKNEVRSMLEYAWQLLNENSACHHCKNGNIPLNGMHKYAESEEPCQQS